MYATYIYHEVLHNVFAYIYIFYMLLYLNAPHVNTTKVFFKSPVVSTSGAATCNASIQQYCTITPAHLGWELLNQFPLPCQCPIFIISRCVINMTYMIGIATNMNMISFMIIVSCSQWRH